MAYDHTLDAWAWAGAERSAALLAEIDASAAPLEVNISGLKLCNPVMTASGCYGFGREYAPVIPPSSLGAICTKCVTLEPRAGNAPPRVTETPGGMLNSIGLQNPGVDRFLREELPWLREHQAKVIVNVAAPTVADYGRLVARLAGAPGVHAIEVNVSCPNTEREGMTFGVNAKATESVIRAVRRETSLPVICKLTPNVTDIAEIALAAEEAGADAISLINTLLGMTIDTETRRPVLGNTMGGLSGPAVRPVAVRMVWQVRKASKLPIIGLGGIADARDAIEFILAGASAVQVGSICFTNPMAPLEIIAGIGRYLARTGISLDRLVGLAHRT
jgi:dihydroorotate dehydrogenase (NAD+) catalytic subunit